MEIRIISFIKKYLLFTPLLFYFGERSLIAYDEGIYALQSKWIIINNNWITPMKWGSIVDDRTIGVQFLIALSQKIFGEKIFAIYVPSILFGSLMIFFTYEIHKELVKKSFPIISAFILCTTFLWINYFHMATQDIIFGSITTLGIYASIKSFKTKRFIYLFLTGIWIGLAFMLKTYLVCVPLIAILPFLFYIKVFKKLSFWIGLIIGFLPFLIWSYQIILINGWGTFFGLYDKLISLSGENEFTNPFYYYLLNFTLNTLPWSIFSIIGFIKQKSLGNKLSFYFLFKYPLIVMILLSIFSTKTPYYPIQILSLTSINTYIGINYIFENKTSFIKVLKKLIFIFFPLIILSAIFYINLNKDLLVIDNKQLFLTNASSFIISFSWLIASKTKSLKNKLFLMILGPYLITTLFVQSGTLSDRSKQIRIEAQSILKSINLTDKKVEVITSGFKDEDSTKKIIKLAIFMPKLGNGLKSINDLKPNQYALANISKEELKPYENYSIVYESENLKPWKLIIKNQIK